MNLFLVLFLPAEICASFVANWIAIGRKINYRKFGNSEEKFEMCWHLAKRFDIRQVALVGEVSSSIAGAKQCSFL